MSVRLPSVPTSVLPVQNGAPAPSLPLIDPPMPPAIAALRTPAQAAPPPPPPLPAPGAPLVLSSPEPKPRPRAKDVAARALATLDEEKHGRAAELLVPKEPYDLPPPMLEAELASLQAAVGEVTLEGEIGRLTLVHAYSDAPRQELTFRDAAHLRTLVQIFPGARVVAIRKPTPPEEDHDAAEPPLDPLDLEADEFPPAESTDSRPQSNSPQSNSPQSNSPQSNSPQSNSPQSADAEEDPFA